MSKTEEYKDKAKEHLHLAYHIIRKNYPQLQEPKLLLSSLDHIYLSFHYAVAMVLSYDHPQSPTILEEKFALFEKTSMKQHHINKRYLKTIKEIKELLLSHKKSPVEFERNGALVICSADYEMNLISDRTILRYLTIAEQFMQQTTKLTEGKEK